MLDNQNNQPNECKCLGDKKAKALEKKVSDIKAEIAELRKELATLRKAVRK
jgi:ribosomal protein L29